MNPAQAFLEHKGRRIALSGAFRLGRSAGCSLPLADSAASREHALILWDDDKTAWTLTDLRSTNGTLLNDVRVERVETLKSGDEIVIGDQRVVFWQPLLKESEAAETSIMEKTMIYNRASIRWLLLTDIKGSTELTRTLDQSVLNERTDRWVAQCRPIIEAAHGSIETFTGDGFLAAWKIDLTPPDAMAAVLGRFQKLETEHGLEFRAILHIGEVRSGGPVASGVEKLSGRDFHYVFKAEKSVAESGRRIILSESAAEALEDQLTLAPIGEFSIAGFEGKDTFYGLAPADDRDDSNGEASARRS